MKSCKGKGAEAYYWHHPRTTCVASIASHFEGTKYQRDGGKKFIRATDGSMIRLQIKRKSRSLQEILVCNK